MSCVTFERLTAYWARDLSPEEMDAIDEHVMGCERCARESERVAAIAQCLGDFVPPVVSQATVASLRARGLRIEENTFAPDEVKGVVFRTDLDLLVHRLVGLDFANAKGVALIIRSAGSGKVLFEDPTAPFSSEGVFIACQRHYSSFPADTVFEVRVSDASGAETKAVYAIPHTFE